MCPNGMAWPIEMYAFCVIYTMRYYCYPHRKPFSKQNATTLSLLSSLFSLFFFVVVLLVQNSKKRKKNNLKIKKWKLNKWKNKKMNKKKKNRGVKIFYISRCFRNLSFDSISLFIQSYNWLCVCVVCESLCYMLHLLASIYKSKKKNSPVSDTLIG